MKKSLIILLVIAVIGGGILFFNNKEKQEMAVQTMNEKQDDMVTHDMDKQDDMAMKDDMASDNMEKHDDMMSAMNEGEMAEMFELTALDGSTVNLADLKGEKVYVKFWASWCSICLSGLGELDELSAMDTDYKVLTIVSPDYNGEKDTEKFKAWFEKQGHDHLTVLLDEGGEITRAFGVRGYPTSAFIGTDGVLVKTYPGHVGNDMIKETFMDIK